MSWKGFAKNQFIAKSGSSKIYLKVILFKGILQETKAKFNLGLVLPFNVNICNL